MPAPERATAVITKWRGLTTWNQPRIAILCAIPVAGMVWTISRYSTSWYFADEWMTLRRTLGPLNGLFSSNSGHLIVFSHALYTVQRSVFGLDGHELLWAALVLSLAAMQLALAALLWRLGMSAVLAMLVATLVTYFGPGAQNAAWQFQWNQNAMFALCFLAAFVALSEARTNRSALMVAALLVLAATTDSQLAVLPSVLVGLVVVLFWPRRLAIFALAPATLVQITWLALGDQGPGDSAPFERMWTFAYRLLLQSAAGLVGGGAAGTQDDGLPIEPVIPMSANRLGLVVLVAAGAAVTVGIWRRRLSRNVTTSLISGSVVALLTVGVLARTRAFFYTPSVGALIGLTPEELQYPNFFGTRYVQYVAIFLVIALAPAITATVRSRKQATSRVASGGIVVALIAVFVMNLSQFNAVVREHEEIARSTKRFVVQTITLIETKCGPARRLVNGPQRLDDIDIELIRRLLDRGAFPANVGRPPSRAIREAYCQPV